jgi:hypothetical protein
MADNFFKKLGEYYLNVAQVLRAEAKPASIFPNKSDIGMSREQVYIEFLCQHLPAKCNIFFGGFLFGEDGTESKQLDVIITTDTTPKFNFYNRNNCNGQSFAPVKGSLGVASIKSTLDKSQLEEALVGIASIPMTAPLNDMTASLIPIKNYDDWPYKIIYASDGIACDTLLSHLNNFYVNNSQIPLVRRPNIIHVAGKYLIYRAIEGMDDFYRFDTKEWIKLERGTFYCRSQENCDIQGITAVLAALQSKATASSFIRYSYDSLFNATLGLPPRVGVS